MRKLREDHTHTGAVRGLGAVSGNPAGVVDHVANYINTNAMSYEDDNGDKLKYLSQAHIDLHNKGLGYNHFNPTSINSHSNSAFKAKANSHMNEATTTAYGMGGEHSPKSEGDKYLDNNVKSIDRDAKIRDDHAVGVHHELHNKLGFNAFRHTNVKKHSNRSLEESMILMKLDELGEYDNKGGTVGAEGLTDPAPLAMKRRSVKEQGVGIRSYTEKPLVEKKPVQDAMPTGSDRGIYEISAELVGKVSNARWRRGEAPSKTLSRAINKKFIESGKKKEMNKKVVKEDDAATIRDLDNKFFNKDLTMDDIHKRREIAAGTSYKDVATRLRTGSKSSNEFNLNRDAKFDEDTNRPDRDLEAKTFGGASGTTKTIHEETKMSNKEHINEALDCILENNLVEMKENLLTALQEKAMEKLEERKKEIAANYFAE